MGNRRPTAEVGTSPTVMGTPTPPLAAAYRSPCVPSPTACDPDALVEVTAAWDDDVLTVAHLDDGDRFTLSPRGASRGDSASLVLPSCERGDRALVSVRGAVVTVSPPDAAPFEALDDVTLRLDGVTIAVRRVPRGEALPPPRRDRFFGASAALALAITGALGVAPKPHPAPWESDVTRDELWIIRHITPSSHTAYAPTHADTVGVDEGGNGRRARGDEGRAGRARSAPRSRRWVLRPSTPQSGAVTTIADQARTRGVFAALGATPNTAARFMPDATERTPDTGNMYGDAVGVARGENGLGLLGIGFGGGGTGEGLIGLGAFATRGHGDHTDIGQGLGGRGGWGCGCGDLRDRGFGSGRPGLGVIRSGVRSGVPTACGVRQSTVVRDPMCAPAEVTGLVDPSLVRRVVRANLGQIRRCYERALEVNPAAEGGIAMRWVIGNGGEVLSTMVEESSIGVASFDECVASAVRRWRFPVPADTVTTVHYPFALSREE